MEKTFKYYYKRYMNGMEENLSYKIKAKSEKDALLKIIIDHQGFFGKDETEKLKKAEEFVFNKTVVDWEIEKALDCINPLGTSDLALYRIDDIIEVKRKTTIK